MDVTTIKSQSIKAIEWYSTQINHPEKGWEEDEIRKAKIEYKKHLAKKRGKQEANE